MSPQHAWFKWEIHNHFLSELNHNLTLISLKETIVLELNQVLELIQLLFLSDEKQ